MAVIPLEHDALAAAVREGLLPTERHWIDFKAWLYPRDPRQPDRQPSLGERRKAHAELARDVASMGLRGGYLIYGVAQDDDGFGFTPVGLDLETGVRETVTQAVAHLVTPALEVLTHVLESSPGSGHGLLVLEVPESPDAPHMVEDRYYARSDTGKVTLSEPEVERLILQRRRRVGLLDEEMARTAQADPSSGSARGDGPVLLLTAVPTRGWSGMFSAHTRLPPGPPLTDAINRATQAALEAWPERSHPDALIAMSYFRKSLDIGGIWMRNWEVTEARGRASRRALGISSAGPVRFQAFPAGEPVTPDPKETTAATSTDGAGERGQAAVRGVLQESYSLRQVLAVLCLLVELGGDAGYTGSWLLGLELRGLRGYASELRRRDHATHPVAMTQILDVDDYRETTRVDAATLRADPKTALERLAGRLLDGLDRQLPLPREVW